MFSIRRHSNAVSFLERAEAWLLQAEAEHNLILGLARQLTHSREGYADPIYLATIENTAGVAGCAYRTPPYKLGLTAMPVAVMPTLVDDLAGVYDRLPAVLGPHAEAEAFASVWSRKQGVRARPGMRQRIYKLEQVTLPDDLPPGHLRLAGPEDLELLATWATAFGEDTGMMTSATHNMATTWIDRQMIYFWEDTAPVSMVGWTGRTHNGVRVSYVYTPPEHRRRGYASAAVAAMSQHLLDTGYTFCILYTDLSNPTSNSIYQRIGYRPIHDVMDYYFDAPPV